MLSAQKTLLTSAVLAAVVVLPGCRARTPANSAAAEAVVPAAPQSGGLDVNDVSILFPLPKTVAGLGQMVSLSLTKEDGTPLMSQELFKDIISHFNYTATIEGKPVKFKSGASFAGRVLGSGNGTSHHTGPFDNYDEWKIVALRYDPCAPVQAHSLAKQAPRDPRAVA